MEPAETHPDRLIDFWEWLVENRTQVVLAIIIAIGAVLIVYTKRLNTQLAEEAAGEDVLAAIDPDYSTPNVDSDALPSDKFSKVVVTHPGTAGARNAKFLQASALFDEGKYEEANVVFSAFASENPQSPLRAAAALGQAACKGPLNDSGAAAAYKAVQTQHAGTVEAVQATLALGRIAMAAKENDKARDLFAAVSTNRESRHWANIATDLLKQLPSAEEN